MPPLHSCSCCIARANLSPIPFSSASHSLALCARVPRLLPACLQSSPWRAAACATPSATGTSAAGAPTPASTGRLTCRTPATPRALEGRSKPRRRGRRLRVTTVTYRRLRWRRGTRLPVRQISPTLTPRQRERTAPMTVCAVRASRKTARGRRRWPVAAHRVPCGGNVPASTLLCRGLPPQWYWLSLLMRIVAAV
jgi:hypothetical protein